MSATATTRSRLVLSALKALRALWPIAASTRRRAPAADRKLEQYRDGMFLHVLDDLDVLSGQACVTDWGLLESAARLRSGWS